MQTVIIIIHLMIVISLVVVVLLQRSEGGALGIGGGGGGGFMSGRAQANALTRATAILAGLFFLTSIGLAWMANSGHGPRSIFETAPASRTAPAGPGTPQVPTQGGILPMLQGGAAGQPQNPVTQAPTAPQVPVHTAPATKPPAPSSPAPASGAPQVPTSH